MPVSGPSLSRVPIRARYLKLHAISASVSLLLALSPLAPHHRARRAGRAGRRTASVRRAPLRSGPFEASDVPVDPGYRFGRLANGMRYVIRSNATPEGTALVRLRIAAGSLDESRQRTRALRTSSNTWPSTASAHMPEGEMVRAARTRGTGVRRRHQCLDQFRADHLHARPAAQRRRRCSTRR